MAIVRKTGVDLQKLIARSESARATLAEARVELKNKLNVGSRIKDAVTSEPAKLIGGSLLAGYLIKKILFKKPKRTDPRGDIRISHLKTERGLLLGVLALITALAKPVAKMYATNVLKGYLERRFLAGPARPPRSGDIPRY